MSVLLEKLISFLGDWRWITTALVFAVTYFVGRFYHKVSKYPKGPFPLPLVGNLLNQVTTDKQDKAPFISETSPAARVQSEFWRLEYIASSIMCNALSERTTR
ncbi:hypothetical protein V5799_008845 [Amblyomma americanum]|uniref:Cytochrome n=1 Tax=Amblyomma americanum TaxID=6943 RepID=A0AAQ4FDH7_AMBAM